MDGFLGQKGDFSYKIVVHDDASSDETQNILLEYKERYPDKIELILQEENQFSKKRGKNLELFLYPIVESKYVAFCEGDDYWIYDRKLQKQYEWMETHPNTTLCVHNAIRYNESAKEAVPQIIDMDTGYISDEETIFCTKGRIPTASFFYRSQYLKNYPNFARECPVGDDPLRWWLAYNGNVYYMDKVWSVRNYMHDGSWNQKMKTNIEFKKDHIRRFIQSLLDADKETNYRFHPYIEEYVYSQCHWDVFLELSEEFKCFELKDWVDKCKKCNCKEAGIFYEKVYLLSVNRSRDYLDFVLNIAKENVGKFYIYGAGIEAKKYAQVLNDHAIAFSGFVVSKKDKKQAELMRHNIVEFDELEHPEEVYFWLCMNYKNRKEVIEKLVEKGISKII